MWTFLFEMSKILHLYQLLQKKAWAKNNIFWPMNWVYKGRCLFHQIRMFFFQTIDSLHQVSLSVDQLFDVVLKLENFLFLFLMLLFQISKFLLLIFQLSILGYFGLMFFQSICNEWISLCLAKRRFPAWVSSWFFGSNLLLFILASIKVILI